MPRFRRAKRSVHYPAITQLHSVTYRNPSQLRDGPVLIVGAGNSGAEIALDLALSHRIWLAGRDTGYIPGNFGSFGYQFGSIVFQTVMKRLTVDTWPGRWLVRKARGLAGGTPLAWVRPTDLLEAGVQRVPRVVDVSSGQPLLEDGRVLDVANVVWATGFIHDYRWIRLPVFDANGDPIHHRGVVHGIALPVLAALRPCRRGRRRREAHCQAARHPSQGSRLGLQKGTDEEAGNRIAE